ncbi:MAG: DUF86 domain-containing protein [Dethiobacter sp.]|jgi:uncharacterized protein with HEPN domain|nr:MAG: DUF86 domain-containing protein [Dethiobacter sp.]
MPREPKVYLRDILDSIRKIEQYKAKVNQVTFKENELVQDGIIRNLEIIGEAVKKMPDSMKKTRAKLDWKKIAGLRDVLIHGYFTVDLDIVWDIVQNKVPELKDEVLAIISRMDEQKEE